ncbi:MAG: hypothetical protein HGA45_37680, partial [Chloroflexales bacterium]|nr:hypothetical protein [Chloroflexales bacterium]
MIRFLHSLLQLLLLSAVTFVVASPALASHAPLPSDITVSARPAYAGAFRVGTWLPVLIDLQNAGIDRSLQVRVGTREGAQYATEVDLPNR